MTRYAKISNHRRLQMTIDDHQWTLEIIADHQSPNFNQSTERIKYIQALDYTYFFNNSHLGFCFFEELSECVPPPTTPMFLQISSELLSRNVARISVVSKCCPNDSPFLSPNHSKNFVKIVQSLVSKRCPIYIVPKCYPSDYSTIPPPHTRPPQYFCKYSPNSCFEMLPELSGFEMLPEWFFAHSSRPPQDVCQYCPNSCFEIVIW